MTCFFEDNEPFQVKYVLHKEVFQETAGNKNHSFLKYIL